MFFIAYHCIKAARGGVGIEMKTREERSSKEKRREEGEEKKREGEGNEVREEKSG